MKKAVPIYFTKIHRKTPVPESFNKVAGQACNFIKKETGTGVFL